MNGYHTNRAISNAMARTSSRGGLFPHSALTVVASAEARLIARCVATLLRSNGSNFIPRRAFPTHDPLSALLLLRGGLEHPRSIRNPEHRHESASGGPCTPPRGGGLSAVSVSKLASCGADTTHNLIPSNVFEGYNSSSGHGSRWPNF